MSTPEIDGVFDQIAQNIIDGNRAEARALLGELFAEQNADIDRLKAKLQKLQKQVYGRRSERLSDEQLLLFQQAVADAEATTPLTPSTALSKEEEIVVKEHRRKRKNQSIDTRALPVEIVDVPTKQTECGCGKPLKRIGFEETKLIERIPAVCRLKIFRRAKMACNHCKDAGVVVADAPEKPVARSLLSTSLLADILVSKFELHLPLNRLKGVYLREGLGVSTQVLSRWVEHGADILKPLANAIMDKALKAYVLNTDDTPVTVLDKDAPGGSKKGRLWVYIGDAQWVAFDYTPHWKAERPQQLLKRRARGPTQSDGYTGYNAVYKNEELDLYEVGCWSHTRRYFVDALSNDKRAAEPLRLIKQLFKLEELARAKGMSPHQRLKLRQIRSKPIHLRLAKALKSLATKLAPKDDLNKAVNYATKRWTALARYLEDGALEMTNNIAERELRRIALGRANWMFAGSDVGARWAAVIYTVVATAQRAGVDLRQYLMSIIPKLVSGSYNDIAELLPNACANGETQKPAA